jgi:hypothetical protein
VAAPFLLWLLLDLVRRRAWRAMAGLTLLGAGVVILLNAPDFSRNYQSFGSPLGPASGQVGNSRITPGVTLSNLVRNATLHTATPWGEVNGIEMSVVKGLLKLIGQDENDPASTLSEYRIGFSYHEDYAGNPVHFALMLAGTLWLFWAVLRHPGDERGLLPWLLSLLLAWLLFSGLFKWQPYGSRLQLPLFLLWAPPAGLLFERLKSKTLRVGLAGLMVLSSIIFVISNPSRPLVATRISNRSLLAVPRIRALFNNDPGKQDRYISAAVTVRDQGCMMIGLMLESSDPEYPLWTILAPTGTERQLRHLNPDSRITLSPQPPFEPCAVICTVCGEEQNAFGLPLVKSFGSVRLYMR